MDVREQLYGRWRLTEGGAVGPVPAAVLDNRTPGVEVLDDGRTSDVGRLLRLGPGGTTGLGLVELEVDDDTTLRGAWRVSPGGTFLADTGGGEGPNIGEFLRPRSWLHDAGRTDVEGDELTLRDPAGQQLARLERESSRRGRRTAQPSPPRASGLPAGMVAVGREQLLGAWEPLVPPSGAASGKRWQNLEFRAGGRWRAFPTVNLGEGPWRHGPEGTLFAFSGGGTTLKANSVWLDLDPWLFPVARAGLRGDELVLLDDTHRELQRLRRAATTGADRLQA